MAGETTIMKLGKTKTLREIENKIEIMKSGKTRTLYEIMWKDSTFDFGMILPTSDDSSSYRFSDGEIFERCFEEVRKEHEKLIDIAKRKKAAPKEEKGNYKKEYEEQKDTYDKKKAAYDEAIKKLLIKQFGLEETQTVFEEKYNMAVGGSGNETFKITTLNSSSLCCLLFFYNVSNNNPLTLKFETNNGGRRVTFTESVFEFKNEVISSPSNIDVVLIGEDEDKKNTILLFLESKFAEYYLSSGKTCDLGEGYLKNKIGAKLYKIKDDLNDEDDLNNDLGSMDYGKSYDLDGLKSLGVTIKKNKQKKNGKDKDVYKIHSNNISYIDGIKQMISHYIGIKNLISEQYYSSKEKQLIENEIKDKDDIIYILGEIAFELPNKDAEKALDNYRHHYKLLAEIIAKQESENSQFQFEILKDLLLYSQITEDEITKGEKNNYKVDEKEKNNYKVDEKVKLFYGMN